MQTITTKNETYYIMSSVFLLQFVICRRETVHLWGAEKNERKKDTG